MLLSESSVVTCESRPLYLSLSLRAWDCGLSSGQGPPLDLTSLTFTPLITYRKLFHPLNSNRYKPHVITYIHTATKVYGLRLYGSSLLLSIVLNVIYPLVPFPSSVRKGVSDVRADHRLLEDPDLSWGDTWSGIYPVRCLV